MTTTAGMTATRRKRKARTFCLTCQFNPGARPDSARDAAFSARAGILAQRTSSRDTSCIPGTCWNRVSACLPDFPRVVRRHAAGKKGKAAAPASASKGASKPAQAAAGKAGGKAKGDAAPSGKGGAAKAGAKGGKKPIVEPVQEIATERAMEITKESHRIVERARALKVCLPQPEMSAVV